jgi:hypothetical protein
VTGGKLSLFEQFQDCFLKLEEPKRIGNRCAVLAGALRNLFLRKVKFIGKTLKRVGLLDRVEVLALEVFNQGHFKSHVIGDVSNHDRDATETSSLGRAPASLACNELVPGADSADYKRLNNSAGTNRARKFVERFFAEARSGLVGARVDQVYVDLKESVIRS